MTCYLCVPSSEVSSLWVSSSLLGPHSDLSPATIAPPPPKTPRPCLPPTGPLRQAGKGKRQSTEVKRGRAGVQDAEKDKEWGGDNSRTTWKKKHLNVGQKQSNMGLRFSELSYSWRVQHIFMHHWSKSRKTQTLNIPPLVIRKKKYRLGEAVRSEGTRYKGNKIWINAISTN